MNQGASAFLDKANQALQGAVSEHANNRLDNCANRAYYACFQAAVYALQENGIKPPRAQWGHDFVQAQFEGRLINRRHIYSTALRGVLEQLRTLRRQADYTEDGISRTEARRLIRLATRFVEEVQQRELDNSNA